MTKRIAAIIFIFFCTSVAWMILGGTNFLSHLQRQQSIAPTRRFQLGQRKRSYPLPRTMK